VGSLEQSVLPAARRFPELGLRVNREIDPIEPVGDLTRMPRAAAIESEPSDETDVEDS
jgi:hypothetical protein